MVSSRPGASSPGIQFAFLSCICSLLACLGHDLSAQSCPQGPTDNGPLLQHIENAQDAATIYRAAAVGAQGVVPALRRISKPGMGVDSVPGAAQVSLARLGDKLEFDDLARELNDSKYPSAAVRKLVRVGNEQALSLLMTYLSAHLHDPALYKDFGDYSYDLRTDITELIGKRLAVGPLTADGHFAVSSEEWLAWWERNKGKPVVVSISGDFHDPYLACLARKVEWGFPDAIYDLINAGGPEVVHALRTLRGVGEQFFSLDNIHGRAELGLAKIGDEQALSDVALALDRGEFTQSIKALQLIGGGKAVDLLMNAFDSPTFLGEFRTRVTPKDLAEYERGRDTLIISALEVIIENPPHFSGALEIQKKQWQQWWAKNESSARFVAVAMPSYE
jgi:hypothetical protein